MGCQTVQGISFRSRGSCGRHSWTSTLFVRIAVSSAVAFSAGTSLFVTCDPIPEHGSGALSPFQALVGSGCFWRAPLSFVFCLVSAEMLNDFILGTRLVGFLSPGTCLLPLRFILGTRLVGFLGHPPPLVFGMHEALK